MGRASAIKGYRLHHSVAPDLLKKFISKSQHTNPMSTHVQCLIYGSIHLIATNVRTSHWSNYKAEAPKDFL